MGKNLFSEFDETFLTLFPSERKNLLKLLFYSSGCNCKFARFVNFQNQKNTFKSTTLLQHSKE